MTSATSGYGGCRLANRREGVDFERRAADERAVDVGLGQELVRVLRLDGAAVEHRHVHEALDERVRLLGLLGRGGPAGADRPHGLVGDDEPLVGADGVADRLDLERRMSSVWPASRSSSDSPTQAITPSPASRAAMVRRATVSSVSPKNWRRSSGRRWRPDAELEEHRSGDLAGERALGRPVDVLGVGGEAALDRGGEGRVRRAEHDVDALGRLERGGEGPRLRGPLNIFQFPAISIFAGAAAGLPLQFQPIRKSRAGGTRE